ncbi:hypothetical protein EVG20_g7789, partial [Dentipellis fragilis]
MHSLSLPSPVSTASNTRKRQRSTSMDSATSSSSPKRSASEDPSASQSQDRTLTRSSPRAQDISHLSLSDPTAAEIDDYLASQGEMDLPATISVDPILESADNAAPAQPAMSPQDKHAFVEQKRKRQMKESEVWYLVSRRWFRRWQKAVTGEQDKEGGLEEKDLGPVDNTSLVNAEGQLMISLVEGVDVEYVPEEVWTAFVSWYGEPIHPLGRNVIARGILNQPCIELHPPRLRVFRLIDDPNSTETTGTTQYTLHTSSSRLVKDLLTDLAQTINPTSTDEFRVWTVTTATDLTGSEYPSGRLIQDAGEIVESKDETLDDAMIESNDTFIVEFAKDGKWIMGESPAETMRRDKPDPILADAGVPPPLFSQENDFFSKLSKSAKTASTTSTAQPSLSSSVTLAPPAVSSSSTFKPFSAMNSQLRSKPANEPGTLGLGNMGNTCFMNSALQCLAHIQELSDYFLMGVFQDELNRENPLGMKGAIAESFGSLLSRIWSTTSTATSYSPRDFKSVLQRFAPQFSGYQQQDSQELVAFLLDGLHEDLNRVLKKPYVEKPDWEGGGDLELVKLARNSWEGYMKRNDSVIVDLFQGQYRSTLICPECEKVSITFDPFMYLTLPLPVQKKWRHTIFYVPWDTSKPSAKVPIEINRDASFKDLRNLLARWMGSNPDHLLTLETFSHRIYKNLDDSLLCGEMAEGDTIVCSELPCHAQQSRSYASKKTDDDPFIIPVFFSESMARHSSFGRNPSLFAHPFIIAVSREDARSIERIEAIIYEQLQRWTDNPTDLWSWEAPDTVHIPITSSAGPDSVTEIKENGDIVTMEEGDIVDEKGAMLHEHEDGAAASGSTPPVDNGPRRVGPKKDIFTLRLQVNNKDFGTGGGYGLHSAKYDTWENRLREAEADAEDGERPVLLRQHDALYLEFDENMRAYYFGDEPARRERAPWDLGNWETFLHPEYQETLRTSAAKTERGISLQDCLDEFTKEEQLGEDDPWYCPQCKKHQQATKKFDIWSVPDVLVVHLKRFSNSRALRDKIETFVDFPLKGLDLTEMAQERQVARKLQARGVDVQEMGLSDLDEPLLYDLYGVDEHLGGLGGGHYRAYAYNHVTDRWYHFDDSYVTPAQPEAAVNANAYLLFYKRRTSRPLGGKTYAKIEAARAAARIQDAQSETETMRTDIQMPTPPEEPMSGLKPSLHNSLVKLSNEPVGRFTRATDSPASTSQASSPPPLDDREPPSYGDASYDDALDPLTLATNRFDFPDPSSKASPTSSNEVEPDSEDETGSRRKSSWGRALGLDGVGVDSWQQDSATWSHPEFENYDEVEDEMLVDPIMMP